MAATVKNAEAEALAKAAKVMLPKAVAPKAPALPRGANAAANIGVAGTL